MGDKYVVIPTAPKGFHLPKQMYIISGVGKHRHQNTVKEEII